jgi:DnaJ-class molecular chaperone
VSDDPYAILGVPKTASQEEIRKAYRKLAKELHPDLRPGDKSADERFKQVSAAYAVVGDEAQRARFDRGEIDASGAEKPPQQEFYRQHAGGAEGRRYQSSAGYEDLGDLGDVFADLFQRRGGGRGPGGPRGPMAGGDVLYQLEVDFLDAVNGAKRRITLPDGGAIDLTIPAGTDDGSVLRLKGKGRPGYEGGPPGDALIEIAVRPHSFFRREGRDIVLELPVTVDEALLGGKVEVPTASGRVTMTVPKGSSSGDTLRLKGKGVHGRGAAGDQRVVLKIVAPPSVDEELQRFMTEWRERHRYDPRAKLRSAS